MVITLYADRRSSDLSDIAGGLAHALTVLDAKSKVVVVGASGWSERERPHAERITTLDAALTDDVAAFLLELTPQYSVTVVAIWGAPTEQVLAALDASSHVLLVSDPSVASIRATQRALKLCASLGYGSEKVAVLLHDFADDAPLAPAEAAAALKREIYGVIPGPAADRATREQAFRQLAVRLTMTP